MIVGLKYAGASDGFPTRINVGDTVKLRLEGTEVSAYHNDRKVGYLSPDKLHLWNSLRPSARSRATVVGEIIDEDGNIAGLDVEISARSTIMPRPAAKAATRPRDVPKTDSGSKPYRAGIGLAVLLASIAIMGHVNTTGPDRSAIASEASLTFGTGGILSLKPSFEPFPEDGQELRRQVQLTSAHRMADEMRRREVAAELKLEAEEQKGRTLQTALEQARQASLLQLKRIEELEEQARQSAAEQETENVRLHKEIASLQQKIDQLAIVKQKVEAAERQAAWRDINDEELVRHRNRITAWLMMSRVQQLKAVLKNRVTLEQAKPEVRAVAVPRIEPKQQAEKASPPEKSSKQAEEVQVRKKNNFSRYAQDYEEPSNSTNR